MSEGRILPRDQWEIRREPSGEFAISVVEFPIGYRAWSRLDVPECVTLNEEMAPFK